MHREPGKVEAGRGPLVQQHHLEERRPREVASRPQLLDQPFEREVLVGVGAEARLPRPLQQRREGRLSREVSAQRQQVHEAADQPLGLHPVAIGHRRAHQDVVLPRDAAEQGVEAGHQGHERGRPLPAGERPHLQHQVLRESQLHLRPAEALHRRAPAVEGQLEPGRRSCQPLAPVAELRLQDARRRQPGALPGRVVGVLQRQLGQRRALAGREGTVERGQLTQEDLERPAVGDGMVQVAEEQLLPRLLPPPGTRQLDPAEAAGGIPGEVERPPGLRRREARRRGAARLRGQRREVDRRQR